MVNLGFYFSAYLCNFLVHTVNNVDLGNDKRFEDEGCEVGKIQHSLRTYGTARVSVAASWSLQVIDKDGWMF